MNRREMLGALGLVLCAGNEAWAYEKGPLLTNRQFKFVDDRFPCPIAKLRNGEGGFTYNHSLLFGDDGLIYFSVSSHHTVVGVLSQSVETLIFRKDDNFYVNILPESLDYMKKHVLSNNKQKPAWLAMGDCHPLQEKQGDFYVIPATKAARLKNPIVKKNFDELKEYCTDVKTMQEKWGYLHSLQSIESSIKSWTNDDQKGL